MDNLSPRRLYSPTYSDIHTAVWGIAQQIRLYGMNLECVVGVSRGGVIPSVLLSHMLGIPMIPISYSAKNGNGDNKDHSNVLPVIPYNSYIIFDDIVDSGETLSEIVNVYSKEGLLNTTEIYTGCVYFKQQPNPPIVPNVFWMSIPEDAPFVDFPWENKFVI